MGERFQSRLGKHPHVGWSPLERGWSEGGHNTFPPLNHEECEDSEGPHYWGRRSRRTFVVHV